MLGQAGVFLLGKGCVLHQRQCTVRDGFRPPPASSVNRILSFLALVSFCYS